MIFNQSSSGNKLGSIGMNSGKAGGINGTSTQQNVQSNQKTSSMFNGVGKQVTKDCSIPPSNLPNDKPT
jgi:hypothetical protein